MKKGGQSFSSDVNAVVVATLRLGESGKGHSPNGGRQIEGHAARGADFVPVELLYRQQMAFHGALFGSSRLRVQSMLGMIG